MIESFFALGGREIVNHTRLQSYIDNGLVTGYDHLEACACPTLSAASFGDLPYVSPAADPAPWYDASEPDSADFAGLLVLSMTGMDDRPTSRSVSQAVTGGGVFGRQVTQAKTIVVQGVLLGSSCCGVAYGLRWLGQALDGCPGGGCDGETMSVLSCCPPEEMSQAALDAAYGRTLRRVALASGPTVTRRAGGGCAGGCTADVLFVEFILQAAEPWSWRAAVEVLSESVPTDDDSACVEWTAVATGEGCPTTEACCRLAACSDEPDCADPSCAVPVPPSVPNATSCFCVPLAVNSACYELDTSGLGADFDWLPIITLDAGSDDLRRVSVTFYEQGSGTCDDTQAAERCDPAAVYHASYVPAGGSLVFDGQIRRALVTCDGRTEQSPDVFGPSGSPVDYVPLGCGRTYCLCVEADGLATPADDATITVAWSGREG